MGKIFDDDNCYCDYDYCEKIKRCNKCCYPSYIDNQVIVRGPTGPAGMPRPMGPQGFIGPTGATGTGGILNFADFYALMPLDNSATVASGMDVSFPQDGPNSGTDITITGPSSFNLAQIGSYQVLFNVGVTEAGQLILTLNGADLDYTVVGRATGFRHYRNEHCNYSISKFNTDS